MFSVQIDFGFTFFGIICFLFRLNLALHLALHFLASYVFFSEIEFGFTNIRKQRTERKISRKIVENLFQRMSTLNLPLTSSMLVKSIILFKKFANFTVFEIF